MISKECVMCDGKHWYTSVWICHTLSYYCSLLLFHNRHEVYIFVIADHYNVNVCACVVWCLVPITGWGPLVSGLCCTEWLWGRNFTEYLSLCIPLMCHTHGVWLTWTGSTLSDFYLGLHQWPCHYWSWKLPSVHSTRTCL
jgi:hypothetical protein